MQRDVWRAYFYRILFNIELNGTNILKIAKWCNVLRSCIRVFAVEIVTIPVRS